MAQKTIPQLEQSTAIDTNSLLVFDSGVQSFKIPATDLAQGLRPLATPPVITSKIANYSPTVLQENGVIPVNSTAGAFNIQLPDPATFAGKRFTIKDIGGALATNNVTLLRFAAETIEGVAASYALSINGGAWVIHCDGVNWWILLIPSAVDNVSIQSVNGIRSVKVGGIAQAMLAARATGTSVAAGGVAISASSAGASSTSGTFVDITNLAVTITTTGRPVFVGLVSDAGSAAALTASSGMMYYQLLRGATVVGHFTFGLSGSIITFGPGGIQSIDFPAAGTYTYKAQFRCNFSGNVACQNVKLVAFEL